MPSDGWPAVAPCQLKSPHGNPGRGRRPPSFRRAIEAKDLDAVAGAPDRLALLPESSLGKRGLQPDGPWSDLLEDENPLLDPRI